MPEYRFSGDIENNTLSSARTAELTAEDVIPSYPIVVMSAWARLYVSTTERPYTYNYHVEITGGYTGDLEYRFDHTDDPRYVNVPITVNPEDPLFPLRTISSITVSETGGHGSSTRIRGTVRVFVEYATVGSPSAPNTIRLNGQTALNLEATYPAQLTWAAGRVGSHDEFKRYEVLRYDPTEGTYTTLGSTTDLEYEITAPNEDGSSYYYYVRIVTLYHAARSSEFASIYTYIPLDPPTALNAGDNPVYGPRPTLLLQLGRGPTGALLTVVADGWTASRRAYPGQKVYLRKNTAYTADTEDTVTVTVTDELVRTATVDIDVSYAAPVYTQPTISAGDTVVKAADITELQEIYNDLRQSYGLEAVEFTPCVAGETSLTLWETHISELHDTVRDIQAVINAWDPSSVTWAVILPPLILTYGPSAAAINQLRDLATIL